MRKILNIAHVYMIVGLVSGLYYREMTKLTGFTGDTQLGVVHTHLLALGMLFFLVVLALEKLFALTSVRLFGWFFWVYNAGLTVTVLMMTLHGTLTVLGKPSGEAIAIVSGLGHVLLTVGLILLFVTLGKRIPARSASAGEPATAGTPQHAAR
ncbi:unnamed protein product [[Actinomadura] parvosata subsp. kistnae]|uniref:DUF2871 domain-containing protein n=1 Tax=[Actinomadura] parvosata subsp. kistnae TaxID=1909395 RepID=A0A1U9ZX86_9ACTN|nr:DUF2871 domain-containing protein [Nonomuraea sp. ATCC 55076]AQZ62566.1 hypothetical protein BKM31_14850 [Nonomuraea sp. ATCC 55076]SPL88840.1 unnamed protein product [Actinomadura parvosata subsp. kistnae]